MIEKDISDILDEKNQEELMELIINTFEKQVSKAPTPHPELYPSGQYSCPECDCGLYKWCKYCPNCGQKIKWEE